LKPNRRENRRFPLACKLRYKLKSGYHGSGEVSNIGSSGLLFQCGRQLVSGEQIEVSIEWPYLLDGTCPLQLCVQGRILRSGNTGAAIAILKYEFRTARKTVAGKPLGLSSLLTDTVFRHSGL